MDFKITAHFDSNIEKFDKKLSKSFDDIAEQVLRFIDILNDPEMEERRGQIIETLTAHSASETNKLVCLYTESLNRLAKELANDMGQNTGNG